MVPMRKTGVIELSSSSDEAETSAVKPRQQSSTRPRPGPEHLSIPGLVLKRRDSTTAPKSPDSASEGPSRPAQRPRSSLSASQRRRPSEVVSDSEPEDLPNRPISVSTRGPKLSNTTSSQRPSSSQPKIPKLKKGKPIKRPPPLPKMIQSCSSVLGLVLSGDDPSHQRHKSTTPLPASGGLNRTGSVLLKSGAPSASGSAQTAGGSQRSVSPEKSEPRGTKRKRGGSPESNHRPKTTVQPHIEDSDSSDENASEDSQSEESEGELRWSTLKEDPAVRWHRAPADDDDWDPSSAQRFNEQYTWKSTTRRQARGSDTFTKLGNSAGFITSYSKPSLARMIVHPCLGHSAQVVLDNNPDGNGSKSKASLEIPLRPAEPDPRRTVPSRLSFEELAEAVGFNSEWLSSQSEEEASRSASSSHQNTAEGASKDDKKGKPKARKSTAPPASVSLVPGGIQQLPMDGPESESPFASTSASKAEDLDTKAKHRRSKTTEQSTQQRPAAGSMRRGKAQMVFEKPQWVWHALMEKIKSEEVPKQVVPPKIWAALHEEGEETGQSDADEVQGDDGLSANEKAMDRGSARAGSIPDT